MKNIEEAKIKKIFDLKERLAIGGIDEQNIIYVEEPISHLDFDKEMTVAFYKIAGITLIEIFKDKLK